MFRKLTTATVTTVALAITTTGPALADFTEGAYRDPASFR